jgi:hypothetical protein
MASELAGASSVYLILLQVEKAFCEVKHLFEE